ncbi:hypothetical protein IWZ01DRAFT_75931 [Phyllosticta capitalensis]
MMRTYMYLLIAPRLGLILCLLSVLSNLFAVSLFSAPFSVCFSCLSSTFLNAQFTTTTTTTTTTVQNRNNTTQPAHHPNSNFFPFPFLLPVALSKQTPPQTRLTQNPNPNRATKKGKM